MRTWAPDDRQGPRVGRAGRIAYWLSTGLCCVALAAAAATTLMTVGSFIVPSVTMANTIRPGDRILADRAATIHRGDVIVAQEPSLGPGYYTRRVIGLPGDHVTCCDRRGRISVDGKPLDETYLYPGDAPSQTRFNVIVPAGKFWLMADHRSMALDSRTDGPVTVDVVGRVFLVEHAGHEAYLQTPRTFVAQGLAPAAETLPAGLIGAAAFCLAFASLLGLTAFGIIRHLLRRHARSVVSAQVRVVG